MSGRQQFTASQRRMLWVMRALVGSTITLVSVTGAVLVWYFFRPIPE